MYKIVLTAQAQKDYGYLHKTNRAIFIRVRAVIHSLSTNPRHGKQLKLSLKGVWSYRVGAYRILYRIENKLLIITVLEIGHRREIYR